MKAQTAAPLGGYRCLVTGAASGIGRAVAIDFAEAGAELVLADCNTDGLSETAAITQTAGASTTCLTYDAAESGASAAMAQQATKAGLDAVVNIGGVFARERVDALRPEDWSRVLAVNLTSVFEICQAALPALRESNHAAIVTTSSTAGLRGIPYSIHYATAKAGVIGMTKALAAELAPQGIRANVIAPGLIKTGIAQALPPMTGPQADRIVHLPRLRDQSQGVPPEMITAAYRYLISDASRFVTGQVHVVDGGAGLG